MADDDYDAEDFTQDITDNERPVVEVEEVRSNVIEWPQYACIYHADQFDRDIKIANVFPA